MKICNKMCRACLKTEESFTHFLFTNVTPETYLFCTSVEVHEDEELPKALCNSCHELLSAYSQFKRTCIDSQNMLLSHSGKLIELKIEFDNDTDIGLSDVKVKDEDVTNECNDDITPYVDFGVHEIKHPGKRIKVKIANEKFNVQAKRGKPKFNCELCSKQFRNHSRFEAHKLEHVGQKMRYQCTECSKTFASSSGLGRHRETSHTVVSLKRLTCPTCGRVSASRLTLLAHQRMHAPRAAFVCHVCGQRSSSELSLKKHIEIHTTDRERRYTCNVCCKAYLTSSALASHRSRQHSGQGYICDHCNYQFTDKSNLVKHILNKETEGKGKPFLCDICSKSFGTNSSLVEHKRIHSGETPFVCNLCPKSFLSKRRLRDHHRIHTGERPHACGVCQQRFTQRGTLQRHMKVHK